MGNYVSCALSTPLAANNSRSAKVLLPGGEIKQIQTPIKAAELMLETPNFFVVNTQSLKIGLRFSPLNADEDLEARNVYVMFPMKRVTSKVTAADMAALFLTSNKAAKRNSSGKARILPDCTGEGNRNCGADERQETDEPAAPAPKLKLDDIEEFSQAEFMHRLSFSRSKKPLLETIAEEPVYAR
ncbi:DUF4228 domain-containing protein [Melia azedarach]|uniref:DUF4228 domain-containing protein n=1 Tax=Melia azedarach TaxID=155640 RepID=A0ACC1X6K8_MELAZ|nr:DUF4228 domain-containing protein [Melia azedarach]